MIGRVEAGKRQCSDENGLEGVVAMLREILQHVREADPQEHIVNRGPEDKPMKSYKEISQVNAGAQPRHLTVGCAAGLRRAERKKAVEAVMPVQRVGIAERAKTQIKRVSDDGEGRPNRLGGDQAGPTQVKLPVEQVPFADEIGRRRIS